MKEKSLKKVNLKLIGSILIIFIILAIILGIVFLLKKDEVKSNELQLSEFERIAIYNYLENDLLNMSVLNILSNYGNDTLELYREEVKYILDTYFSENTEETFIPSNMVYELLQEKFGSNAEEIDFHGILINGYEYDIENDGFTKEEDNFFYDSFLMDNNQICFVNKIEKLSDVSYKVYIDIVDKTIPDISRENYKENNYVLETAEVIINIENGNLVIQSCEMK